MTQLLRIFTFDLKVASHMLYLDLHYLVCTRVAQWPALHCLYHCHTMFTLRPRQEPAPLTSPDGEDLRESNLGSWRRAKKGRARARFVSRSPSFFRSSPTTKNLEQANNREVTRESDGRQYWWTTELNVKFKHTRSRDISMHRPVLPRSAQFSSSFGLKESIKDF